VGAAGIIGIIVAGGAGRVLELRDDLSATGALPPMFVAVRNVVVLVAVAAYFVAGSASVEARNVFVDNVAGDDRADGMSPQPSIEGGPVRTIARALALALTGDHVHLANTGEPYRESISLSGGNHSGFEISPFTLVGNGAVLDGSRPVPADDWEGVRDNLFRFHPPRGSFPLLFLDGRPAVRVPVDAATSRLPALAEGQWCSHNGFIYFATADGKLPREYPVSFAALPVGITLYHVKNVTVLDLVVQGFYNDGVNAHDGVRNGRLGGLILRGNGRAGLVVAGSSKVSADGCLIGDNGTMQVLVSHYSALSLQLCELLAGSAPVIERRGGRLFIDGEWQD